MHMWLSSSRAFLVQSLGRALMSPLAFRFGARPPSPAGRQSFASASGSWIVRHCVDGLGWLLRLDCVRRKRGRGLHERERGRTLGGRCAGHNHSLQRRRRLAKLAQVVKNTIEVTRRNLEFVALGRENVQVCLLLEEQKVVVPFFHELLCVLGESDLAHHVGNCAITRRE